MSTEVWGVMPKSQDDPESVEDAINRLISDHEADPEAHLGAGESLETHRQDDILDHPPGSILPDKVGANVGIDGRGALNQYTLEVDVGTTGTFGDLRWSASLAAQVAYEAHLNVYFSTVYLEYDDFLDMSFYLNIGGVHIAEGNFSLTLDSDLGDNEGFRIRKDATTIYLDALDGTGTPIDSVVLSSGSFGSRRMRFVYDIVEQKAYAYMNGVLMMTVVGADFDAGIGGFKPGFLEIVMSRVLNTSITFSITGWVASYGLPNL